MRVINKTRVMTHKQAYKDKATVSGQSVCFGQADTQVLHLSTEHDAPISIPLIFCYSNGRLIKKWGGCRKSDGWSFIRTSGLIIALGTYCSSSVVLYAAEFIRAQTLALQG